MAPPLRHLAIRWMAWATVARVAEDGLHLAGRLVLARLLWPEAFGTFTLAVAIVAGVQLGCQLQLNAALVQRAELSADIRSTAFWSLVVLGMVGAIVLAAVAAPVAAAIGHPGVAGVIRALCALVALSGLSAVPRAWLWREFGFRQFAVLGCAAEVVGTVTAIGAAIAGAGVYALVAHALAVEVTELAILWAISPWRPRRHWQAGEFAELVRFGWPLAGRRALDYVVSNGDRFLIGYAFGPGALGLYALALRLVRGLAQGISAIFERVAFPVFARAQDDLELSRRGFLDALRAQAALTFPAVIGLALLAREVVPLALGHAWVGAAALVQILAIRAAAGSLAALPRAALTGRGRQWLVFELSAWSAAAYAAGWLAGLPWGPAGVAAGGAAAGLCLALLSLWMVRREIPVAVGDWARALAPALTGAATMAVGLGLVLWATEGSLPAEGLARTSCLLATAALCYVLPLGPWLTRERRRYTGRTGRRRAVSP